MPRNIEIERPLAALGLILSLGWSGASWAGKVDAQDFVQIQRGRYLSIVSDCAGCHTVPGGPAFAGGRPIETPFGNITAPNITPDLHSGIGAWSDDQFDAAVRKGIRQDGSLLYPAMPYNAYTKMSREDVLAIRAYLRTVEAVPNQVVANTLPFPFNIRTAMRVWNALYFKEGEYVSNPSRSREWNRGAFLVDGPAHCGACHTPKSLLGGDESALYLQGSYVQGWSAPDITNNAETGLGAWTADDVVAYLKTGHNRITGATGIMAEAISLSTSKMTDDDVKAIATYLKSLPGGQRSVARPLAADDPQMVAGSAIYRDQCSSCHGLDGKGVEGLFPSIADSPMVRSADLTTAMRVVLRGARSVATDSEPTAAGMPSYAWQLTDEQIAAVLTYMRNSWGRSASAVPPADVARLRSLLADRPD